MSRFRELTIIAKSPVRFRNEWQFSISMSGNFLPIQLIYKGKTVRCHPRFNFPTDFHVTHNDNHWANEETSIQILKKIIIPYIEKT